MDKRLVQLDFARGLAALLVCLGHLRAFTFVNFANVEHPTYFDRAFYFVTGFGHQSVIVFFVLSGVFRWRQRNRGVQRRSLVMAAVRAAAARPSLGRVASGAGAHVGLGCCGQASHGRASAMRAAITSWLTSGPSVALPALDDWTAFLGNAFFFQGIAVPTFGTNGVLWSLANEFWYYALFPLGFVAATANSIGSRVAQASLLVALLWWLPPGIVFPGLIWLFGCAAYVLTQRAPPAPFLQARLVCAAGRTALRRQLLCQSRRGLVWRGHRAGRDLCAVDTSAGMVKPRPGLVPARWPADRRTCPTRSTSRTSRCWRSYSSCSWRRTGRSRMGAASCCMQASWPWSWHMHLRCGGALSAIRTPCTAGLLLACSGSMWPGSCSASRSCGDAGPGEQATVQ